MNWSWNYFDLDGTPIENPTEPCVTSGFPNQPTPRLLSARAGVNCLHRELALSP